MTALARLQTQTPAIEDFEIPIPATFRLASGDALDDTCIRLRRCGAADGPQVIALGGISAGRDVCGETGWWRETLTDHEAVDLDRFGLVGIDFAPLNDQRVRITPHDQARLIVHALDALGIEHLDAFIGASYGGMIGLALGAIAPDRVARLCIIATAHKPAAQSLAWRGVQRRIVEFGLAQGAGADGLALARQLAMITYRTPQEFEARFGAGVDAHGTGEVDRYLTARGAAYAQAVAPHRWLSLSESIDRFFVDPATVATPTTVVASPDDQLAPLGDMRALAERLPNLLKFKLLPSLYGHDAFLKEPARLAPIIRDFLKEPNHG